MKGLFLLTLKEILKKKIFLTVFFLATFVCILLIFALNVKVAGMDSGVVLSFFGQQMDHDQSSNISPLGPEDILGYIQTGIAVAIFFISLFFSLFATAGIFPDILKKGNIDLILSKPLSRKNIFFQRFSGAVFMISLNIIYIILFSWLILSVKFEIWNFNFLYSGIVIILFFFILFSIMTLFSMISKNMVVSLMITYFIVFIISPVIAGVQKFGAVTDSYYGQIVSFLHSILPKISETVMIIKGIVMSESYSAAPLWTSFFGGLAAMTASVYIFKRTDF